MLISIEVNDAGRMCLAIALSIKISRFLVRTAGHKRVKYVVSEPLRPADDANLDFLFNTTKNHR